MANENILSSYVNNNYDKAGNDNLTKFFAYNQNIYVDPSLTGFAFIFVTKPSLFLYPYKPSGMDTDEVVAYSNMCADPEFSMYIVGENENKKDQTIIKQLSYFNFSDSSTLFLPIFTNLSKAFNPIDTTLDAVQAYQTREGFNLTIPTNTTPSEASGSITLNVSETDNLDFTKMLSIWVKYIRNITNGTFSANPNMIKQNMLDYTSSIYYFFTGPDGKTLKYWSRYTGCYPYIIPYGNLIYMKGSVDSNNIDIPFYYTLKEDMNPRILEDFNMLSLRMVSPQLFSQTDYSSFLENSESENSNGYTSYTSNSLLNKNSLINGNYASIVNNPDRDPLIFYKNSNTGATLSEDRTSRYVLSFGDNCVTNQFANSILETTNHDFVYDEIKESLI